MIQAERPGKIMRSKKRLTAVEFDMLRPFLKMTEDRIAAARAMMVDGLSGRDAAAPHGWVRQNATDAANLVWRAYEDYQVAREREEDDAALMPPGWARVTLIAPIELIARFRDEIAEASVQGPRKARTTQQTPDAQPEDPDKSESV